ncbi:hypothetical protein ACLB2K_001833 [Fragaria x ananassa]
MMAKMSTLIGMFLVQWLAISVRTLAAGNENSADSGGSSRPPTEEELGAWLNVLKGAEFAIQNDKYQTALAMVSGVAARLKATVMSDQKGQDELSKLLTEIEHALKENDKDKAIMFTDAVGRNFEHQHAQTRARKQRHLHENADPHPNPHPDPHANPHPDPHPNPHPDPHPNPHPDPNVHDAQHDTVDTYRDRQMVSNRLQEVFLAINENQLDRARHLLRGFYRLLRDNRDLVSNENAVMFLHAIHQAEQHVREGSVSQATQALEGAASALGTVTQLQEGEV